MKPVDKLCECMICDNEFYSANFWAKVCSKDCYLEKQRINSCKYRHITGKEKHRKLSIIRQNKYYIKHRDKVRAQKKLQYAVVCKKITRPEICEKCFISCKPQGHHRDYSKPLEVVWLCARCHKSEHLQCV